MISRDNFNKITKPVVSYETTGNCEVNSSIQEALQRLFEYFNQALFQNVLPRVEFNMSRSQHSLGHYIASAWFNNTEERAEINISPIALELPLKEVAKILVQQMALHFLQHFSTPSRPGYYNMAFAKLMMHLGLAPSITGLIGGNITGQRMNSYIIEGGPFDIAFKAIPNDMQIPFKPTGEEVSHLHRSPKPKHYNKNKTCYVCPSCNVKVYGQRDAHILCMDCNSPFIQKNK